MIHFIIDTLVTYSYSNPNTNNWPSFSLQRHHNLSLTVRIAALLETTEYKCVALDAQDSSRGFRTKLNNLIYLLISSWWQPRKGAIIRITRFTKNYTENLHLKKWKSAHRSKKLNHIINALQWFRNVRSIMNAQRNFFSHLCPIISHLTQAAKRPVHTTLLAVKVDLGIHMFWVTPL